MHQIEDLKIYDNVLSAEDCKAMSDLYEDYESRKLFNFNSSNRGTIINFTHKPFNVYLKKILNFVAEEYEKETGDKVFVKLFWTSLHFPGSDGLLHIDGETNYSNKDFVRSAVIYLNDDFEGGSLYFPRLNKFEYLPKAGQLVIFPSQGLQYMHRVNAIKSGKRKSIALWFTDVEPNRVMHLYPELLENQYYGT